MSPHPSDPDTLVATVPTYEELSLDHQNIVNQLFKNENQLGFTNHPFNVLCELLNSDTTVRLITIVELVNLHNEISGISPEKINLLDKSLISNFMNDSLSIFGDMNIDQQYRDNINNSLNNPEETFEKCLKTVLENAYLPLIASAKQHGDLFQESARELSLTADSKTEITNSSTLQQPPRQTREAIPGVTEPSQAPASSPTQASSSDAARQTEEKER
ncbi:hypothetical protein N9O56_00960 [Rickettsiales bacterium]|nr:hypothetical protein [Rickettsiales bacterium]